MRVLEFGDLVFRAEYHTQNHTEQNIENEMSEVNPPSCT